MGDIITTDSVATEPDSDTSNETMISPDVVSKHNDLVGASYRLSVAEQRLILLAIAKIDSRKPMPNGIVVTAHDFMSRYTVNKSATHGWWRGSRRLATMSGVWIDAASGRWSGPSWGPIICPTTPSAR